jgi:hypothetical protein
MIHLSNLELDELSSLFSRKDLRDSSFQDTIIKVLCLGKSFLNLIKENHGLHEDDVIAEHMIPTTFHEETEFLSDSNLNSLKRHYMTFYWKVRKDFLDYVEESHMIFILRTSIMHFYPNLTLKDTGTMLRRNLKKIRIM